MKRSLVLLLMVVTGLTLPVAGRAQAHELDMPNPATGAQGSPPALTAEYAETTVRAIYDRFAEQVRESGEEISLSLSGVQTIWPKEFGDHYWVDLVTMPGGWTLSAGVITFVDDIDSAKGEQLGMKLDPRWWEADDWLAFPGNEGMHELTYAYVVENGGLPDPTVLALTTFFVEVGLKGRTRTYQAAAEWLETESDDASLRLQDNVILDIAAAVTTHLEIMVKHPALARDDTREPR